jgi:hypothetical protein
MKRLLALSLITALAGFAGCGGSADPNTAEAPKEQIDVQLEGTWQSQVIINEKEAAKAKPEAVELIKSMKMEMTFRDDGTLILAGEVQGEMKETPHRWDLVGVDNNKITITSVDPEGNAKNVDLFFSDSHTFDMPLSTEVADLGAMRFTRVR